MTESITALCNRTHSSEPRVHGSVHLLAEQTKHNKMHELTLGHLETLTHSIVSFWA